MSIIRLEFVISELRWSYCYSYNFRSNKINKWTYYSNRLFSKKCWCVKSKSCLSFLYPDLSIRLSVFGH